LFYFTELAEQIGEQWHHHRYLLTLDVEAGLEIFCDRFRMEQVIINLLTNAMKYGEQKPISIGLTTDQSMCVLSIQDNGIGVEKNKQKTIFERYERALSHQSFAGLGLGLFIAKQYILAHHGSIEVQSDVGRGSTFIVKIPMMPEELCSTNTQAGAQLTV
jgi:signal transduction histidine kinase